ncbi:MAG: aminoglycoside phosphotransferase [Clostridia bacterium]|nr:aminoglycoside phosphotransferase [Clostridia bacterium]MBQ4349880.1 aminoglycoside phosphotransferase [Clostridia bacterium]
MVARDNLKTDMWGDRFLDAYGRDAVEEERLRAAAAAEAVAGD